MKRIHFSPVAQLFLCFSFILIAFALSRWIETDGGKILIHKIDIEITETSCAAGKIYRPLNAQSLNQRPAVVLVPGLQNDKDGMSSIAIELAKRGYVALSIDNFGQGSTPSRSLLPGESVIDSAYSLLKSQSFVDKERIGIVGFSVGTIDTLLASELRNFASILLLAPYEDLARIKMSDSIIRKIHIISPFFNEFTQFRASESLIEKNKSNQVDQIQTNIFHFIMPIHPRIIAKVLDQIHADLQIPNDTPLWFNTNLQSAWIRDLCQAICFVFWLIVILPVSELLARISKNHLAITPQKISSNAVRCLPFLWIVSGIILYIIALIIAYFLYHNSNLFYRFFSISVNLIWISSMVIFWRIPVTIWQKEKDKEAFSHINVGNFLISLLIALTVLLWMYGTMRLFSRVFMIDLHFIFPFFRSLDKKWLLFLSVFFISSLFFGLYSNIFASAYRNKHSYIRFLLIGIGSQLIFLAIEYIPVVFFQTSGWEWLFSSLRGPTNFMAGLQEFNGFVWGFGSLMALFNVVISGALFLLQTKLAQQKFNNLFVSFVCSGLYSWLLISGTTQF